MLALPAFAWSGIPIWKQLDTSVSTGDVAQERFIIMDGFVSVRSGSVLNDVFTLDLEEDVVGSERAHGLLGVTD